MKKIYFGHTNEKNPTGSWDKIGIDPNTPIMEGEYICTVKYENDSYLIAKADNKIIVRPALADMYPDGSGNIFLNQQPSLISQFLEKHLNNNYIKIKTINDILAICNNTYPADRIFTFLTMEDDIITTSITPEEFELKNTAIKNCHLSFSDLQEQINEYNYTR